MFNFILKKYNIDTSSIVYKRRHTIDYSNEDALTDYVIYQKICYRSGTDTDDTAYMDGKCQPDFRDIRFKDDSGVAFKHAIVELKPFNYAIFAIKLTYIPSGPVSVNIYIWHNDLTLTDESDYDNTFIFFDKGSSQINDKWAEVVGSLTSKEYYPDIEGDWYQNLPAYGGATATYPNWTTKKAIYSEAANKTFLVYSTRINDNGTYKTGICITYYDHEIEQIMPPTYLDTISVNDTHRGPAMMIDANGYIWVFYDGVSSPIKCLKSVNPLNIGAFNAKTSLTIGTYPQPMQLKNGEIICMHRDSTSSKWVIQKTNDDGESWSDPVDILAMGALGYMQVFYRNEGNLKNIYAFINSYTNGNIYYAYSDDGGDTWKKSNGATYTLPITDVNGEKIIDADSNETHVSDVLANDIGVFCLCKHKIEGTWYFKLLRLLNGVWSETIICTTDHMYDVGALVDMGNGNFSVYLPSVTTQPGEDGGDIEEYRSSDYGATFTKYRDVTSGSALSHNHVISVYNSRPDCRVFWSYGDSSADATDRQVKLYRCGDSIDATLLYWHKFLRLIKTTSADSIIRAVLSETQGNAAFEADMRGRGASPNNTWLGARMNELGHNYNGRPKNTSGTVSQMYKYNGAYTSLATGTVEDNLNFHKWAVACYVNQLRFLWDNTELISTTDSSYNDGSLGVRAYANETHVMNARIRKYVNPEPTHGTYGSDEEI